MDEAFSRSAMLLGEEGIEKLQRARVAVFGLGGVGGSAAEALVRAGVGTLDVFDNDTVSRSNLNRQAFATLSTVGMKKTDAAVRRLRDLSETVTVNAHDLFFLPENADTVDFSLYDCVIDAIDTVTAKLELAVRCNKANVPLISCLGTGNKLDPSRLRLGDVFETSVCPLARVMRHELRKRGIDRLTVVWSDETPIDVFGATPGSVPYVPPAAGLLAASAAVEYIQKKIFR